MKYPLPDFRPKKSFGQNFLTNPRIVETILRAADLRGSETVLEVGPGFGILTSALLQKAKKVIAIEKDDALFAALKEGLHTNKLELIHGDALKIPPPKTPYFWIANIPYAITSPLLDHYIREQPENLPVCAVLLVQKEVAEKLCAKPPRMNVLALHVQFFGIPRIVAKVSRNNFKPVPRVDSAIVRIDFDASTSLLASPHAKSKHHFDNKKCFALIHKAFSQKRKMLRATLPQELLKKAVIEETRRAETLTIEEWKRLARG